MPVDLLERPNMSHVLDELGALRDIVEEYGADAMFQAAVAMGWSEEEIEYLERYALAWIPWRHQVPPGDMWQTWGIEAGRGAGKSDAIAHYVADHVNGPPCDPRVPGGHRMAMLAPTLGDALEAAYLGPSSVRAHDPNVRKVVADGGTMLVWPNGSMMRLVGGDKPDSADRFRAGGNRCLGAGTMVTLERGLVPIESVRVGDMALTRQGYRPVLASAMTGIEPLYRVTLDDGTWVDATADHEFFNGAGVRVKVCDLSPGGVSSLLCVDHASLMSASGFISGQTATTAADASDVRCSCTEPSTRSRSARSATVCTCTTSTTTSRTTPPATSGSEHLQSTGLSTHKNAAPTGTAKVARPQSLPASLSTSLANTAASQAQATSQQGSTLTADPTSMRTGDGTRMSAPAACAARRSECASIPHLSHVPRRVDHVTRIADAAPVYDLSLDGVHEFFANGVLSSNCLVWVEEAAAIRYLAACAAHIDFGLRIGPSPRLVFSTTPKRTDEYMAFRTRNKDVEYINGDDAPLYHGDSSMVVVKAKTTDNAHLPAHIVAKLYERYGGTDLGRQELLGELIDEVKGALWKAGDIVRVPARTLDSKGGMAEVVVGVDPSTSEEGTGDACGIIVVGRGMDGLLYIIDDFTMNGSPGEWVTEVEKAYRSTFFDRWTPSRIILEGSGGGGLAREIFSSRSLSGIPIETVYPQAKKADRARPIATLWEQKKARHLAPLPALEQEMTTWEPLTSKYSPNRIDALVHAATHLFPTFGVGSKVKTSDKRLKGRGR